MRVPDEQTLRRLARRVVGRLSPALRPLHPRTCNMCGFEGRFGYFGRPPRLDAECMRCGSLERHRLFWLWFVEHADSIVHPILHFAPERIVEHELRSRFADRGYRTADLLLEGVDLRLDMECIDLPTASIGTVVCSHVLEHVDDVRALAELHRILRPDGRLICAVPLVEGWSETYEDPTIVDPRLRLVHFGKSDHVRMYGRDFRCRLTDAGFGPIEEVTAEGPAVITHGLLPGDKLFLCRRSAPAGPPDLADV